jgi:hypothetical protein
MWGETATLTMCARLLGGLRHLWADAGGSGLVARTAASAATPPLARASAKDGFPCFTDLHLTTYALTGRLQQFAAAPGPPCLALPNRSARHRLRAPGRGYRSRACRRQGPAGTRVYGLRRGSQPWPSQLGDHAPRRWRGALKRPRRSARPARLARTTGCAGSHRASGLRSACRSRPYRSDSRGPAHRTNR